MKSYKTNMKIKPIAYLYVWIVQPDISLDQNKLVHVKLARSGLLRQVNMDVIVKTKTKIF